MNQLLADFAKARRTLQEAQEAWSTRTAQKGPWLPILDRLKAAEKEEQQTVDKILSGNYT